MGVTGRPNGSLRPDRVETSRLFRAFVLSLVLHLFFTGTYFTGKRFHWWDKLEVPKWMQSSRMLAELHKQDPAQRKPQDVAMAPPTVFVDVSPHQETTEPPQRKTPFYSRRNSQASNPQPKDLDIPKIEGVQEHVIQTEDVPREKFTPLQALLPQEKVPQPKPEPATQPQEKARPAPPKGDLALTKPSTTPRPERPDTGQAKKTRPASVREAMNRRENRQIPGQKMKQDGGVKRDVGLTSLDAKASVFGDYDAELIRAIKDRWYTLLDERAHASDTRGKVVLRFRLHPDGRISELTVAENTVGEMLALLCQKAVLDPQPYTVWPLEMRRVFGETRNIQFTFYYN